MCKLFKDRERTIPDPSAMGRCVPVGMFFISLILAMVSAAATIRASRGQDDQIAAIFGAALFGIGAMVGFTLAAVYAVKSCCGQRGREEQQHLMPNHAV